ncbi:hypothetical protein AURDEDRAFT_159730 [Auricularia subglabra TFB-10046 SS5]|nr:hypothetical protein AURDEDRAFT_159730 [Auricularia subglabra TFB-10046 SS5]
MSSRSLLNSTIGQKADFARSILFTVLYALLLPVGIWRLLDCSVPYDGPTVDSKGKKVKRNDRIGWLGTVLDLALLAAPIIAIYSGSITGKAFRDPETAHTVLQLRRGGSIIFVIVVGLIILALGYYHFVKGVLNHRSAHLMLVAGLFAMVPCGYKLAQAYQTAGANTTTAFWLAQALPELRASFSTQVFPH